MRYQLTIRKFVGSDASLKCKFLPGEELEVYALALVEELENINTILAVLPIKYTGNEYTMEILLNNKIALEELKSLVFKILLSESFECVLKFKNLHVVE